ncbi:MAG: PH domain-containing protein [Verrucomicrobiota bacterium]
MNEESSLWKGSPAQWLNLWPFAGALALAGGILIGGLFFPPAFIAIVLPLGYMIWRYLLVRTQVFELTSERLRVTSGVINQKIDEIELYRVKDSHMVRPWWMRVTGLASIVLETSDRSMPHLIIPAIHGGVELRELLRRNVELQRDRKRVRETDFDEVGGDGMEVS